MKRGDDFWSRRRAAVTSEAEAEAKAVLDAGTAEAAADLEERPDDEILAELGLPDPAAMKQGDDFTAFLQAAVPERLRRRALRQLWRSNPVLANVDGLVQYGGDFTDASTVVENLQTAYQVGKGMLKHVEALMAQAEEAAVAEETLPDPVDEPVALAEAAPDMPVAPPEAEAEAPPPRRRMQFQFDAEGAVG